MSDSVEEWLKNLILAFGGYERCKRNLILPFTAADMTVSRHRRPWRSCMNLKELPGRTRGSLVALRPGKRESPRMR